MVTDVDHWSGWVQTDPILARRLHSRLCFDSKSMGKIHLTAMTNIRLSERQAVVSSPETLRQASTSPSFMSWKLFLSSERSTDTRRTTVHRRMRAHHERQRMQLDLLVGCLGGTRHGRRGHGRWSHGRRGHGRWGTTLLAPAQPPAAEAGAQAATQSAPVPDGATGKGSSSRTQGPKHCEALGLQDRVTVSTGCRAQTKCPIEPKWQQGV